MPSIEGPTLEQKNLKAPIIFFLLAVMLPGCIGTDLVDDPIVGQRIEVSQQQVALRIGQSQALSATYYDSYGIAQPATLNWSSSHPEVATVDQNGLLQALSAGQSLVKVSRGELMSPLIYVNVIADENAVASVEIASPRSGLNVGEQLTLSITIKNILGDTLPARSADWFSENSSILQVDNQGRVTALSKGVAAVHAKVNGVKSNSLDLSVGDERTGQFVSAGGYTASGTTTLRIENGQVILRLENNFQTSFALGTYIYLSQSTNASQVRASGLEVAQIRENGAASFNISQLNSQVDLHDYRYVVVLCKPATVTFGYAELK